MNDGFRWVEIAELNNLEENPGELVAGTVLILPDVELAMDNNSNSVEEENTSDDDGDVITDEDSVVDDVEEDSTVEEPTAIDSDQIYIVQKGDTLWDIAERFYGDGSRWMEIFENPENNLSYYTAQDGHTYPMIHAGNILVVPAHAAT